mmetsp:Transcript_15754/g.47268  ORF Transcript_15754/g.47268 Transcript_15754/m.47268 type:complete len:750 (-) Transcript_15754:126-2375(-)
MQWTDLLSASSRQRPSAARVRKQLLAARNPSTVLRVWQDNAEVADCAQAVIAIHRIAKTLSATPCPLVLQDRRWHELMTAAFERVTAFKASDLANVAWSLARAGAQDEALFKAVALHSRRRLPEFCTRDLVALAWSVAKATAGNEDLITVLADAAEGKVAELSAMDTVNMIWALGKAEVCREALLLQLAQQAADRAAELTAQDAANTAWGLAKAEVKEEHLFLALGEIAVVRTEDFGAQELASMLWAFAWVAFRHEPSLQAIAERATQQVAVFNGPGLARVVWAFAKLEKRPRHFFEAAGDRAALMAESLGAPALAKTAWAFAKVDAGDLTALRILAARSVDGAGDFSGRDLGMMAWAMARASVRDEQLMQALAFESVRKIQTFTVQGLTKTISAFAVLAVRHSELMNAVASEAVERIHDIPPQGLADLSWASAALEANHPALAHAISSAPGWTEQPQYEHRLHAGSIADCFKHTVLVMLLERMAEDSEFVYVDTHAGGGIYDLSCPEATQLGDAEEGILRIADRASRGWQLPPPVERFLEALRDCEVALESPAAPPGGGGGLRYYAGSAVLAGRALRPARGDAAVLFESSPAACTALRQSLRVLGPQTQAVMEVRQEEVYSGLRRVLPRLAGARGLVFVDPPYDVGLSDQLNAALLSRLGRHWASSSAALWYPIRDEARTARVYRRLQSLRLGPLLVAHLAVGAVRTGVLLVRPPERMDEDLREVLPALVRLLAPDSQACVGSTVFWL